MNEAYIEHADGIWHPKHKVSHSSEAYDESGHSILLEMQRNHFWYRGRHRFLLNAVQKTLRPKATIQRNFSAIDLGGGCGGWVDYLAKHAKSTFSEIALGDSSLGAVIAARKVIGQRGKFYHVDCLNLGWEQRWDVVFLLDVLEHVSDDVAVMKEVYRALKPGGYLFVTMPALKAFWSLNDEFGGHLRRYNRDDLAARAKDSGFRLVKSRYFMFFLSPLLWLSRMIQNKAKFNTPEQIDEYIKQSHKTPSPVVNTALRMAFSAETPSGWYLPFPWGTSILGIYQKPY